MIHTATWQPTTVVSVVPETSSARSLVLGMPLWSGHVAGQHLDIRLTASDGYQASRSYSISSGPGEEPQITVEKVDDGEVSPHLVDVILPGDHLEARGPLGGYFVWEGGDQPLALIGGGSGIAPLRAMWRKGASQVRVLYSARTADRVLFQTELLGDSRISASIHLTREDRDGYVSGRVDRVSLKKSVGDLVDPAVFVCGPTAFVEGIASQLTALLGAGYPIRTERFG